MGPREVIEGNAQLNELLHDREYAGRVERSILFHVEAWDVNCPQHIHRRLPASEVEPVIAALQQQISDLQNEIGKLNRESSVVSGLLAGRPAH